MSSYTRSSRFKFECISTSCWRWDTHPTAKLHPPHTGGTAEALVQMDMDHQGRQIFYPTEPQNSLRKIQRWWIIIIIIIIIIIMGASEAFQCHHSLPFQYPDTTCVPRQLKSSSTPGSSSCFAASKQHSLKFIVTWNHMNGYNKNGTIWKYEVFPVGFSLHPVAGFDLSRVTGLCSLQPSNGSEIFKAPQGKPREPQQNLLPFGGKPSALFWSKNCDPL